jgi:hypothetical protein
VIAFQKNLIASTDAHHLVADLIETRRGVAGAKKGEEGEAEENRVHESAA